MSVLYRPDVPEMPDPGTGVSWIGIRIANWPLRGWSRCDHPFPACNFGLQKAIPQDRDHRDRIEDEDQQHHRVGQVDIELVVGDSDHQLETDPVEQRQRPDELCIPWTPKPVGSVRRRRWRGGFLWRRVELMNILHLESLSIGQNSTNPLSIKPAANQYGGPTSREKSVQIPPLHSLLSHSATICASGWRCRRVQVRTGSRGEEEAEILVYASPDLAGSGRSYSASMSE